MKRPIHQGCFYLLSVLLLLGFFSPLGAQTTPKRLYIANKPAEDTTTSLIARLWNLDPEAQDCSLQLAPGVAGQARRTSHIDPPWRPLIRLTTTR
jgi:hypothetical protein